MKKLKPVLARIEKDFDASVSRYADFLRIPSISTDPAYKNEVKRAGEWLAGEFKGLGFSAVIVTGRAPCTAFQARNASRKVITWPLSSTAPLATMRLPCGPSTMTGSKGGLSQSSKGSGGCTS